MLRLYLTFQLFLLVLSSTDVIIQPIKQGRNHVAIIFLPGFGVPPERYVPLFEQVQSISSDSVWIAIPAFFNDIPLLQIRPTVIDEILSKLSTAGMPINTKIFLGGHSLGSLTSQELALRYQNRIAGQILTSAYLLSQYQLSQTMYPVSTLILSGELDGLTIVTRVIESFYFYSAYPHFTLIIPGMNHMGPASGLPPPRVLLNDLPSEINQTTAHQQLAILISDYINMILNNRTTSPLLEYHLHQTKQFSQPYLKALNLEGSYHLTLPCYNTTENKCQSGSPWSEYAQEIISGLPKKVQLKISDQFNGQSDQYPRLDNQCSSERFSHNCVLVIHTVTENIYDGMESKSAALEMRVKMISRQTLLHATYGKQHDFNQTDGQSLCSLINQDSLKWAMKNAGKKSNQRYEDFGRKLIIGDDIDSSSNESTWIQTPLVSDLINSYRIIFCSDFKQYNFTVNSEGQRIAIVQSPTYRTVKSCESEIDGFHFCKLLSPARTLEWIYVNSLRP